MCNYRDKNICRINNNVCPWVYWCDKINAHKELSKMPKHCRIIDSIPVPDGYNKVEFERNGYLYVKVDNQTIKIKNPFDYIPTMVKIYQSKSGWKIRKIKE